MHKKQYLADRDVGSFIDWLQKQISGVAAINFNNSNIPASYLHMSDALASYSWPDRRTPIPLPTGLITLSAGANLSQNAAVLGAIAAGLTATLPGNDTGFADWAKGLMTWGGVAKGNNKWITLNTVGICSLVGNVTRVIALQNDDRRGFPTGLRFNAGKTKLYSLLSPDFVIYDSRVAAGLTWLICQWSSEHGTPIPDLLKFRCLPGQNPKTKRNPDPSVFPQMNGSHRYHLHWNIRANWILAEAFSRARGNRPNIPFTSLREVEAALFMIGQELP